MFCPKCGGEYKAGITRCRDCGVQLTVEEPDPRAPAAKRRVPWVAAVMSLLVPGLGQLYVRLPRRALIVYLTLVALGLVLRFTTFWFAGLVTLGLCSLLYRGWAAFDAWRCAARAELEPLAWYNRWYVYGLLLILASVAAPAVLRLGPTAAIFIPAASMEPALESGDRVMVRKLRDPAVEFSLGEVVVFRSPERPEISMVKRIAALPGQDIQIVAKRILLDGREAADDHATYRDDEVFSPGSGRAARDHFGPYVVPTGAVFLLGDNRDESYDSRFFGPVPIESVTGKVLYVYWSRDLERIGRPLH